MEKIARKNKCSAKNCAAKQKEGSKRERERKELHVCMRAYVAHLVSSPLHSVSCSYVVVVAVNSGNHFVPNNLFSFSTRFYRIFLSKRWRKKYKHNWIK